MKNNWPVKKLGEVTDLIMGQSPPSSTYNSIKDGLPFYQGKVDFGELFPTPRIWCSNPVKITEPNDVLICVRAPVGPTNLSKERSCIGRGLAALRSKLKELDFMYLLLYLRSIENGLSKRGSGTTFSAIGKKELENLEIPVPPIEEQKRIVKKLEKILAKIEASYALRQESVKDAELILKSAIYDYFSTTTVKRENFRDVAILERGKFTPRPRNDPKYFGGSIPWIQIGDITNKEGKYITTYSGTLNEQGLAVSRMFNAGTVVTSIAASIGTTGILGFDSAFPDSLIGIQGKEVLNSYVYYYLLFMQAHLNFIAPQVAQKNINLKILGDLEIPVPDLKEQEKIIAYLDSLSEKVQVLQKLQQEQLQDLEALKQSVLHKSFQGEL